MYYKYIKYILIDMTKNKNSSFVAIWILLEDNTEIGISQSYKEKFYYAHAGALKQIYKTPF